MPQSYCEASFGNLVRDLRDTRPPHPGTVGDAGAFAQWLFSGAAYRYDRVAWWLSYGQYPRWHRFLVSRVPRHAELVLDVATGTGAVAGLLAARGHRVVAVDLTEAMLRQAVRCLRGSRVRFLRADARRLPFADASFDAVTFTFLLRYVEDPAAVVRELGRVVRRGGWMASLEFGVPPLPWRWAWRVHTRVVLPVGGRLVSDGWARVGRFLGPSIEAFCRAHPFHEVRSWWEQAGFCDVEGRRLSLGAAEVMWGRKD
jgi:demethylmenaquinone methyltransferase/2-methoxy-6-polyprenyl-1,4-benzoquinol methylase